VPEPALPTLDEITDRLRRAVTAGLDLGCAVKLDLKGEGLVRIAAGEVTNEDGPADLTVRVSRKDLGALARRELDPTRAMMSGRLKLSDMGLAMKLQPQIQALFAGTA
jgi:putative sterol carrier protein